jgi:pyruvate formate lyase activating enzyme
LIGTPDINLDLMKKALWWSVVDGSTLKCDLCPHNCLLSDGQSGICRIRINKEGILYSSIYGLISAIHVDPVEKKPLYHFYPGSKILSIGTVGCNLRCRFCQNCEISQVSVKEAGFLRNHTSNEITEFSANSPNSIGVAFTYNEPAIWFEYVMDVAKSIHELGQKNVMVTNGFINPSPLDSLLEVMDAFSVDLKGFEESFYRKLTSASLKPVLATLVKIRESAKHLEIVNLVIPGLNDDPVLFEKMIHWIESNLGSETVLHLSAYYPRYLATQPPTPASVLRKLSYIAKERLSYVYTGNLPGEENNTFCPSCRKVVVNRVGYSVDVQGITTAGKCKYCGITVFQNF